VNQILSPSIGPESYLEPRWARWLFAGRTAAWLWLVVRLYMAYIWIPAGWEKITSGEWLGGDGSAMTGLLDKAIADPGTPSWYVSFLKNFVEPNAAIFADLVALGEFAVGLGLLVGLLTGIAAFFGVLMNANYVLAGVLSSNPVLIVLGALTMLAWRNAGWIGLDRIFIPWVHRRFYAKGPAGLEPTASPASGGAASG
jgi:thiosulfate dehydrogenase (quinone) large subunit